MQENVCFSTLCCYNFHCNNYLDSKASLWSFQYKNTRLHYYIQKGLVTLLQCNYNTTVTMGLKKNGKRLEFILYWTKCHSSKQKKIHSFVRIPFKTDCSHLTMLPCLHSSDRRLILSTCCNTARLRICAVIILLGFYQFLLFFLLLWILDI